MWKFEILRNLKYNIFVDIACKKKFVREQKKKKTNFIKIPDRLTQSNQLSSKESQKLLLGMMPQNKTPNSCTN